MMQSPTEEENLKMKVKTNHALDFKEIIAKKHSIFFDRQNCALIVFEYLDGKNGSKNMTPTASPINQRRQTSDRT